jgi:hypothetical protein
MLNSNENQRETSICMHQSIYGSWPSSWLSVSPSTIPGRAILEIIKFRSERSVFYASDMRPADSLAGRVTPRSRYLHDVLDPLLE